MRRLQRLKERMLQLYKIPAQLHMIREALGRVESRLQPLDASPQVPTPQCEFKVYSQWGEDGILDYLISRLNVTNKSFVEFGVENYTEANTLFLLKHRGWRGLVIDGSEANIASIRSGDVFWRYDLQAVRGFITRENINDLIGGSGFGGELGLLSVDIDGNDYWVWEAITAVRPVIVVCEYNSLFGLAPLSTPYRPDFVRTEAHPSRLYYGASVTAFTSLAASKGYSLVAGNSAGNNIFFVRNDALNGLAPRAPEEIYVRAAFRETRSAAGAVELLTFEERQKAIQDLPLVHVPSLQTTTLRAAL